MVACDRREINAMKARLGRWLAVWLVGVMFLALALPVAAQDGMGQPNCNGLSEADCQILQDAAAAIQNVSAFAVPAWSVSLQLEAGADSVALSANGSARAVLPEQLLTLRDSFVESENPSAAVLTWVQGLDAEQIVQILQGLGLELRIDHLLVEAPEGVFGITGEGIFKDGGLYIYTTSPNGAEAWFGDRLRVDAALMEEIQSSLDEASQDWDTLQADLESLDFRAMQEALQPVFDLLQKYITTTREADTTYNGQTMHVFTTTFDVPAFLNDPDLAAALLQSLQALSALDTSGEMDMEDLDINEAQMRLLLTTAGLIVKDSNYSVTVWIGADDSYTYREMWDVSAVLDLSLFGEEGLSEVTFALQASIDLDEFNTATMDDVVVPESYEALDDLDNFLPGVPEMIEATLEIGKTYNGALDGDTDTEDIFALPLEAGQTVQLELSSEDYPYLSVYGPDGFQVAYFDTYYDTETVLTAEEGGEYLVVVEADWAMDYDLTVRAE